MRQYGDRAFQSSRALTVRDEKANEHAKGGRALFRCGPPTGLTAFDDKLSKTPRIERVGVATETAEQLNNVNPVIGQGALTRAPLIAHPLAERDE